MGTPPLKGRVAVVAGATRGAGRGIARMLGEAGATVYCTGRSTRASDRPSPRQASGRPETIEETAELVTAAGGVGIPVRVDHTQDDEVAALFQRVARDHQRVDVLANVITGDPASWKGFLEETPGDGRRFVDTWVWPHISTAWHAAQIMATRQSGLLVELVEQDGIDYHGAFYFDLMEILLKRHIFALAHNLGQRGVTAVAVEPGFMRTEAILEEFGVTEANWRDGLEKGNSGAGAAQRLPALSAGRSRRSRRIAAWPAGTGVSARPGTCPRTMDSRTSTGACRTARCWSRPRPKPRRRSLRRCSQLRGRCPSSGGLRREPPTSGGFKTAGGVRLQPDQGGFETNIEGSERLGKAHAHVTVSARARQLAGPAAAPPRPQPSRTRQSLSFPAPGARRWPAGRLRSGTRSCAAARTGAGARPQRQAPRRRPISRQTT